MSDDRRHDNSRAPDASRALAALGRLPRAEASPSARARARAAFVHGAEVRRLPERARPVRRWATGLAAAAVAAWAIFWYGTSPVMDWVALDVVEPAGVSVESRDPLGPGARLVAGPAATSAGSELEVQLGDRLRFRMMPGTVLDLPRPPGRWFDRDRDLTLAAGEIFGTTGGRELGFELALATLELEARLTGTTFAVFRTDSTSCVCLWNGGVTVTPKVGPDEPIVLEEQTRVWIYKDGRSPEVGPLNDMEIMKLQMTRDMGLAPAGEED